MITETPVPQSKHALPDTNVQSCLTLREYESRRVRVELFAVQAESQNASGQRRDWSNGEEFNHVDLRTSSWSSVVPRKGCDDRVAVNGLSTGICGVRRSVAGAFFVVSLIAT